MTESDPVPVLTAVGISKSYGPTNALADVGFELMAGEIHALVGENGAGKSTLARILSGIATPDAGAIELEARPYHPLDRLQAEAAGVRIVLQELNQIPSLSVAENLFLRRMPTRRGLIDRAAMRARASELTNAFGLAGIDPDRKVGTLSVGVRQMIEIAGALSQPCKVLILDEPTAALTDQEAECLFGHLARLKAAGVGVIYVSHRMEEIKRIADRITVLRDGRKVATLQTPDTTLDEVIRLMVGRDVGEGVWREKKRQGLALKVEGLEAGPSVRGVSFELYKGEILGVAGLMGSGRTETVRAIFGADRKAAGTVSLDGEARPARIREPKDAVRRGIGLLTEDRKDQGLLLSRPIRENVTLTFVKRLAALGGWIPARREAGAAESLAKRLGVRCRSIEQLAGELSGGNQQKLVLAKWLGAECAVLLVDEPTRGIDVGAKFEIYALLNDLADQGNAILAVSSDLAELMALCDRIVVMSAGRVAASFSRGSWSSDAIIAAALSGYGADKQAEPSR